MTAPRKNICAQWGHKKASGCKSKLRQGLEAHWVRERGANKFATSPATGSGRVDHLLCVEASAPSSWIGHRVGEARAQHHTGSNRLLLGGATGNVAVEVCQCSGSRAAGGAEETIDMDQDCEVHGGGRHHRRVPGDGAAAPEMLPQLEARGSTLIRYRGHHRSARGPTGPEAGKRGVFHRILFRNRSHRIRRFWTGSVESDRARSTVTMAEAWAASLERPSIRSPSHAVARTVACPPFEGPAFAQWLFNVFIVLQAPRDSPNAEASFLSERGVQHASMTMGDLIRIENHVLVVCLDGFPASSWCVGFDS